MTIILKAHTVVGDGAGNIGPDAVTFGPLGSAGSSLAAIFAIVTRALGTVAVMNASEALALAERIDDVVCYLDPSDPDEQQLDRGSWPYWQVLPCPSWCAVVHRDEDPIEEREHETQFPPVLDLAEQSALSGGEEWLKVRVAHHVTAALGHLEICFASTPFVRMYADEVRALSIAIRASVEEREPEARATPYFQDADDFDASDEPWPGGFWYEDTTLAMSEQKAQEARSSMRCPSSGMDHGRMIEIPGSDEWKIECTCCGRMWAGGSTFLDEHDRVS